MDQDSSNQPPNNPSQDPQPPGDQTVQEQPQPQPQPQTSDAPTDANVSSAPIQNVVQEQNSTPSSDVPQDANYIENVGGSLLDLIEEVNSNDNLIQIVADEMKLDVNKIKSIITGLLDKVDNGQLTTEELAFIMAVTVVDESPEAS